MERTKFFYSHLRWYFFAFVKEQFMREMEEGNSCVKFNVSALQNKRRLMLVQADSIVFLDITQMRKDMATNNSNRYVWNNVETALFLDLIRRM